MLVEERRQEIIKLVNKKNSVRVSELSNIFSVTKETIRKDLELLEQEGKLLRSHGGALRTSRSDNEEIPYTKREIMNAEEKEKIARLAAKQIAVKDTIILDASTTAWNLAKFLPNQELTVITNSIRVATELSTKDNIQVISTGGHLSAKTLSYIGDLASRVLDLYHVNKAFISCKAFHLERGMSESSDEQARIKEKMIENSDELYLMVDHSKFGNQAFSRFSRSKNVDYLITDDGIEEKVKNQLHTKSLKLLIARN